jgi:hypothetical protein
MWASGTWEKRHEKHEKSERAYPSNSGERKHVYLIENTQSHACLSVNFFDLRSAQE